MSKARYIKLDIARSMKSARFKEYTEFRVYDEDDIALKCRAQQYTFFTKEGLVVVNCEYDARFAKAIVLPYDGYIGFNCNDLEYRKYVDEHLDNLGGVREESTYDDDECDTPGASDITDPEDYRLDSLCIDDKGRYYVKASGQSLTTKSKPFVPSVTLRDFIAPTFEVDVEVIESFDDNTTSTLFKGHVDDVPERFLDKKVFACTIVDNYLQIIIVSNTETKMASSF